MSYGRHLQQRIGPPRRALPRIMMAVLAAFLGVASVAPTAWGQTSEAPVVSPKAVPAAPRSLLGGGGFT